MVKVTGMLVAAVVLFFGVSSGQLLKVYRDGVPTVFSLSEVDSITFAPADSGIVLQLRIGDNEISGWNEDTDGFKEFHSLDQLIQYFNGGAVEYYDRGVQEGFIQYLYKSGSENTMECRMFDCGDAETAATMYAYRMDNAMQTSETGNLSLDEAFVDPDASLTGCAGYAHFGRFFMELLFGGYGSNKAEAVSNAGSFIEVLKQKIDALN